MREGNYIFKHRSQTRWLGVSARRLITRHAYSLRSAENTLTLGTGSSRGWKINCTGRRRVHPFRRCHWDVRWETQQAEPWGTPGEAHRRGGSRVKTWQGANNSRLTDSYKVDYNWGTDRHAGGDTGWDWQMPGGSDLQRTIWVTVWRVTCRGNPRRHWHSRSLKRLQDVVLLLLLHSWNQTEGRKPVRARRRLIHYTAGLSRRGIMDWWPH